MTNKIWCIGFLLLTVLALLFVGGMTALIDPFFHYHAPLDALRYQIYDQRYQNDGIVKHFDYDALITGTSVTENFKTSEFDALFDANSIKVPFAGGSFREINENIARALAANSSIRYVVRGLDAYKILEDKDEMEAGFSYPTYLYDDYLLNDVSYLFNKTVFLQNTIITLRHTMLGFETTSFDEYSNWMRNAQFGRQMLPQSRGEKAEEKGTLTDVELQKIRDNLDQNVISLIEAYPDVQFYYFFPPYSIYWWSALEREGTLEKQLEALREATTILAEYENLHLFSFYDEELIENTDLYKDTIHYHEDVNAQILKYMADDLKRLTPDNCEEYWDKLEEHFMTYPYEKLF